MPAGRIGRDGPEIADAAAAIVGGIGVDQLLPLAGFRHADAIAAARHRREIADHRDRPIPVAALAQIGEDRVLGILGVDPLEAGWIAIVPVQRRGYRIGVPEAGEWEELINTDAADYGGSGVGNLGAITADATGWHGRPFSLDLSLPPLATVILQPRRQSDG